MTFELPYVLYRKEDVYSSIIRGDYIKRVLEDYYKKVNQLLCGWIVYVAMQDPYSMKLSPDWIRFTFRQWWEHPPQIRVMR